MIGKKELSDLLAERTELSKTKASEVLTETLNIITEQLTEGKKVQIVGFGTFEVRDRKERQGRNPKTGEEITIPASKNPAFKAGKQLKDKVNN